MDAIEEIGIDTPVDATGEAWGKHPELGSDASATDASDATASDATDEVNSEGATDTDDERTG